MVAREVPSRSTPALTLAPPVLIAGAWILILAGQATGTAAALHHHALIEGGLPLWVAMPLFLLGWLVMVTAMMLPASMPAIRVAERTTATIGRPLTTFAGFLGAFGLVWVAFGLFAFLGDVGLHSLVDRTPWLAERSQLIEASVLALAGAYQLTPLKQQMLRLCRHPGELESTTAPSGRSVALMGLRHGLACLGSSWALMLLMFAESLTSMWWMVALTFVMTIESTGRHGQRAASIVGVTLLVAAVVVSRSSPVGGA